MTIQQKKYSFYKLLGAFALAFLLVGSSGCSSSKKASAGQKEDEPIPLANLDERKLIKFKELFFNANKEKMLGNHEEAAQLFEQCLEIYPTNDAVLFELSMIKEYQSKLSEAIDLAEKAVQLSPDNKWYLMILSEYYRSARNYDKAIETHQHLVELYPNTIEYSYELASLHIMNNDLKSALGVYNELEERYGINQDIIKQKKEIYLELNEPEKAVKEIEKLTEKFPAEVQYFSMLAEVYGKMGETQKALETYKKIQALDPNNPFVQLSLVDYYANAGEMEKSNAMLKESFGNTALDVDTKIRILMKYFEVTQQNKNDLQLALELNEIVVETHPESPQAHAMYGDFLYRERMFEKAQIHYEKSLEIDQSKFLIWNQLLIIDSELGNFETMAKRSEEAIALFPIQPTLYYFNGLSNSQLKKYDEAINALEAGKELVVDNEPLLVQFYANLGDAYFENGNYSSSFSSYEKALEKDPKNVYVLNNYSYFLSLAEQNLEKAEKMALLANELSPNNLSYLDTYAWVLFKKGEYLQAKETMDKAFSIGGKNNGTLLEHYGDILYRLGEKQLALEYWNKAFEKGSEDQQALQQKIKRGSLDEN